MRLFLTLWRTSNMPNGNIFKGKRRLVPQVTKDDTRMQKYLFEIEENNMFLLRHPYMTLEQSSGHAKALGNAEKRMDKLMSVKKDFKPHVSLESRLSHLRHGEKWD